MSRPVRIARVGAVGPFGSTLEDFSRWWQQGRPTLVGPLQTLREDWLPTDSVAEVPDWRARKHIPDRKAIKLMTPRVQFGVAAALEAWTDDSSQPGGGADHRPERCGMYTGCGVAVDEEWTFREAIEDSIVDDRFDIAHFGGPAQDLLNPLWLIKSLTNNVLAFTAKSLDLQGANDNFEAGAAGPLLALGSAGLAIAHGRLDRALAGGSDSLVTVEDLLILARHGAFDRAEPIVPSQGASFVRLEPGGPGDFGLLGFCSQIAPLAVDESPHCSPWPSLHVEEALDRASAAARSQAGAAGRVEPLRVRGPRLPGGPGELDLWSRLGDPGAAAGAFLLAAAWALHEHEHEERPIELAAAGPGGEVAVALLGRIA